MALAGAGREKGKSVEVFLLILPWFWIAVAVWILVSVAPRAARPLAVKAFGLVLVMVGVSDFFVTPAGAPPSWLVAWKVGCVLAAAGILVYLRIGARRERNRGQECSVGNPSSGES